MRPLPLLAAPPALRPPEIHSTTLANGMSVAVVERRDLPMVHMEVIVRAGAEHDMPAEAGRFSMLAEMIDEGTTGRTAVEIAEQLDYLGAYMSAHAGWDATSITTRVLSSRLLPALDIIADLYGNAAFPPNEFRRKRTERLNALLQERDEAAVLATKALAYSVFGDHHPYGAPIDGTRQSVAALDLAELAALYEAHYNPHDTLVLIVGDVDAARIAEEVSARFRAPGHGQVPRPALPAVRASQRQIHVVDKPNAPQSEVRVGHTGVARDSDDYFPLMVMNTVLGGSFTSRLNMILREKMGVTYGASSRFRMRRSGGIFTAGAAILTEAAARSARVIVDEMSRLREEAVGEEELRRAQSYIALGLPRSFETTEDIASHVREQLLHGLADDYWQTYVERTFSVTAEDVMSAAARHLHPDHCSIVVVADRRDIQSGFEQSGLGELVSMDVQT